MGTKDMVMTMTVVLVVVGLIALYGQNVSFAPGGQALAKACETFLAGARRRVEAALAEEPAATADAE
jgi:autotransporter translocation and assembly factor TamB